MRALLALCVMLAWPASGAVAREFIAVPGALEDESFYRLIACAAPPGAPCEKDFVFWPEEKRAALRVGLAPLPPGLPDWRARLYRAAVDHAISEVNRIGAGLKLAPAEGAVPDVAIHIIDAAPGAVIEGTGLPILDGAVLPLGRVAVRTRGDRIVEAVIAISAETNRRAIASVVLEETVQALGLLTDIRSPAYRRSIFSEDSNSGTRLRGQDAMVIRRHYPAN